MRFETRAVHAGHRHRSLDRIGRAAHPSLDHVRPRSRGRLPIGGHTYIRESNPNQEQLEEALAPLEGGEAALVFASGMAAGHRAPPGAAARLARRSSPTTSTTASAPPPRSSSPTGGSAPTSWHGRSRGARARRSGRETRLVWLETPSNPLLQVIDLAGAAALARARRRAARWSTTPSPPRRSSGRSSSGADVVLHSTTKYFGGHSDVQGGALVFARRGELCERVAHLRHVLGAVASPFNDWLVLRGVRTLACRVAAQSASALAVARALEGMPAVAARPLSRARLPPRPRDRRAARCPPSAPCSRSAPRGGGRRRCARCRASRLFTRATSLGGAESLIEHRATSEGPASRTPQELIRAFGRPGAPGGSDRRSGAGAGVGSPTRTQHRTRHGQTRTEENPE